MSFFRSVSVLFLSVLVASCGGGSSGGSPSTVPFLGAAAVQLPDLSRYYPSDCPSPFISTVTAVDLLKQGRNDLVIHMWCQVSMGSVQTGPTRNALVVMLRQPDGSYVFGNHAIFGRETVSLEGTSRKVVVGDVNGDGYPDLAYATNREDHRSTAVPAHITAQPAVMLSQGDGTYRIELFGTPDWLHAVDVIDNDRGGVDFVFQGFNNVGGQIYRWRNDQREVFQPSYDKMLSGLTFRFLPRESAGQGSRKFVTVGGGSASLELHVDEGGTWKRTDSLNLASNTIPVSYRTYSNDLMQSFMISYQGKRLVTPGFEESCLIRLSPQGPRLFVGSFVAGRVPDTYDPNSGQELRESSLATYRELMFFDPTGGTLVPLPSPIEGEDFSVEFNQFDCADVNGDGFDDIVVYPFHNRQGVPIFYLNDRQGRLVRFDTTGFPTVPGNYGDSKSLYQDLDGDGLPELIQYPQFSTAPFLIFPGVQKLP